MEKNSNDGKNLFEGNPVDGDFGERKRDGPDSERHEKNKRQVRRGAENNGQTVVNDDSEGFIVSENPEASSFSKVESGEAFEAGNNETEFRTKDQTDFKENAGKSVNDAEDIKAEKVTAKEYGRKQARKNTEEAKAEAEKKRKSDGEPHSRAEREHHARTENGKEFHSAGKVAGDFGDMGAEFMSGHEIRKKQRAAIRNSKKLPPKQAAAWRKEIRSRAKKKQGRVELGNGFYTVTDLTDGVLDKGTGEKDDTAARDMARLGLETGESLGKGWLEVRREVQKDLNADASAFLKGSLETSRQIRERSKTFSENMKLRQKQARKKKIKRDYAKEYRTAHVFGGGIKGSKKTKETADAARKIVETLTSGSKTIVVVLCVLLAVVVFVIGAGVSIASPIIGGIVGGTQSSGYQSSPSQIDGADLAFSKKEVELEKQIEAIETKYRGYDEYSYTLGTIWHNPFTLINYLSAKYGKIERAAMNEIDGLFNDMYSLSIVPTTETRTRLVMKYRTVTKTRMVTKTRTVIKVRLVLDPRTGGIREEEYEDVEEYEEEEEYQEVEAYWEEEEYTVKVLKTTLTVTPLETVVAGRMSGNAQAQQLYAVYGYSHGLVQAFASPVDFDWNSCIGSQYGYRENETTGAMEIHRGVDILMAEGTKVKSSMDGIVKEASYSDQYGYYVSIKHEKGYVIRYAHMRSYCVRVGDHVTQGQEIGTSGGMGTTMGSHIHVELMKGSTYMNPLFYVANGY